MTADQVWAALQDRLVQGAHHELNNRVASLSAVEQVVSAGGTLTDRLREALVSELVKMRWAVDVLGRIPPGGPHPTETMLLQDSVATAVELVALSREAREARLEVEDCRDLTPVRADRPAVERALLLMLESAARSGGPAAVTVTCSLRGDRVLVTVSRREQGDPAAPPPTDAETTEAERLALAAWLRPSGGSVDAYGQAGPRVISLPALLPA